MITADTLWGILVRVRERQPLVHNITNYVTMNNTANVLLAIGASPAMILSTEEVEDFVANIQALVVNIGTLSPPRTAAIKLAIAEAHRRRIPWVLDPVGVGATPYRTGVASALIHRQPTAIRGNGSEILTLAQRRGIKARGVDSTHSSNLAIEAARQLARETRAIIAVTGKVDYITDGHRMIALSNGHPLMTRVTGLGCCLTSMIGAFLAVETDPFMAATAAVAVFSLAGEVAAEQAKGPGTLQIILLDTLYGLDSTTLTSRLRFQVY